MSQTDDEHDDGEVHRLLGGAARTIAHMRSCWLVTEAAGGGSNVRPMGCVLPDGFHNDWIIRFVADGRSLKASEIRRAAKVGLIFQHDLEEAFVALSGTARLIEVASDVRRLWKEVYNVLAPTEADRANAIFVEVNVERMKLWIRGLTPEPFGFRASVLERDAAGTWRSASGDRNAG